MHPNIEQPVAPCGYWALEMWLEQQNVKFYLILISLDLNSHVWLVATLLDSADVAFLLWLRDGVEMLTPYSFLGSFFLFSLGGAAPK